jgi:glycosyltransferase involved in cell wall biosynthesis
MEHRMNGQVGFPSVPLVSVGLPTYNRAGSLDRAIRSVLAQDYPAVELVISDNASTDGTQALCEAYAEADARVRYLRQPINRGAVANFQEVLKESQGVFFMWLGDDDWLDPSYLSRCVGLLLNDPELSLVAGRVVYCRGDRQISEENPLSFEFPDPATRVFQYFRHVSTNGAFYGVMRRSQVVQVPYSDYVGADWLLVATIALFGKIRIVPDVTVYRSIGGASSSLEKLVAASSGLSSFYARRPFLFVSKTVFEQIGWRAPAYRALGFVGRRKLAVRAGGIVFWRCYFRPWLSRVWERMFSTANPAASAGAAETLGESSAR